MKKRTKIRAQFVLLATLIIAMIIFSTFIVYYSISRSYEQISRSEVNYKVTNISIDFDRATLNALANASQTYGQTGNIYISRKGAISFLSFWQQLTQIAYGESSIKIGRWDSYSIKDSILGTLTIPQAITYNDALNYASWVKLYWYKRRAISIINVTLAINTTNPVLIGYKHNSVHFLNITATYPIPTKSGSWKFNITVVNENGPDTNLSKDNIKRFNYINSTSGQWVNATNYTVTSNGNGTYTIFLNDPNVYSFNSGTTQIVPILLGIQDERNIYAELMTYNSITFVVQDNGLGSNNKYRVYTVGLTRDGTMEFNLIKFTAPSSGLPAIPPIPVKQFRINTTKYGPNDSPAETPFQIETWQNINTRYEWPLSILTTSTYSARFSNDMKIVFLLYFNYTTSQQKIVIWWQADADAPPKSYGLNFKGYQSGYAEVDNGFITFRLVVNQALSNWIDYSVQLSFRGYHAEYWLFGYDYYPFSGGIWYPKWLPSGDPSDRMGWNALIGPVRIILYRISNKTYAPPTNQVSYTQYQHYDLIIIPYSTTYVIYRTWDKWLSKISIYTYITPIGIISGSSSDIGSDIRLKYWAYPSTSGIISGSYASSYSTHIFSYDYPSDDSSDPPLDGNWVVEYQSSYSFGLIFNKNNLWNEVPANYTEAIYYKVLWIWTTADYARRVIELDIVNDNGSGNSYNVNQGISQWYWVAFFAGDGGSKNNGYISIRDHSSMFNIPLQIVSVVVG